jgi:hypothetical protein
MMYIRYPPSLRQVEDLLFERGIDICGIVRLNRCGSLLGPVVAFLSRALLDQLQANSRLVSKPKKVGAERVGAVILL